MNKFILIISIVLTITNFSSNYSFAEYVDRGLIHFPLNFNLNEPIAFLSTLSLIAGEHYLTPYLTDAALVKFKNEKNNFIGTLKGSLLFALPYLGITLSLVKNPTSEQSAYILDGYVLFQILGGIWGNKNL